MLSNALETIVEAAVMTELADAKRAYGDHYASPHEGYGVLAEELHEALAELRDLESLITGRSDVCPTSDRQCWHCRSEAQHGACHRDGPNSLMEDLHDNDLAGMICDLADVDLLARHLACEVIQVAAVARKYSETLAALREEETHA